MSRLVARHHPIRWFQALLVIGILTVVGIVIVVFVRAAGVTVSQEAENSTLTAGATSVSDTTASGGKYLQFSSTIGSTPYGFADYCALEGTNTVIYGWASDPNATAASDPSVTVTIDTKSLTVPTNVAGYRDAPINAWIASHYPGEPTTNTYGYKAVMGVFSKSTSHPISGTIINVGAGANAALSINKGGIIDGDATKQSFVGGVIPASCLGGA